MLTVLSSFAQEESKNISDNVKWRYKKKFESEYMRNAWRSEYCGLENLTYDDGERFPYFSKAVLESIKYMGGFTPDIIHCNDWQCGIVFADVITTVSYTYAREM